MQKWRGPCRRKNSQGATGGFRKALCGEAATEMDLEKWVRFQRQGWE